MSDFKDARCRGRSALWDSNDLYDHQEAAAECAICPALDACRTLLRETQADIGTAMQAAGGGPCGTWAGELIGKGGPKRAECGTDSGYFRHRRYGEPICGDCREAHSVAESRRYVRRRMQAAS